MSKDVLTIKGKKKITAQLFFSFTIDASFIYAYYNKDDVHHKRAIEISNNLENGAEELIIIDYVFDEVISVSLNRLKNIPVVKKIGEDIINSLGIDFINEEVFKNAWRIFSEQKYSSFSFTDCIILSYMKSFHIKTLITFDKGFNEIDWINVIN